MICKNCGKELGDDAKFCNSCGEVQTKEKQGEQSDNVTVRPKKKRKKLIITIIILLLIILISAFLVIYRFFYYSDSSSEISPQTVFSSSEYIDHSFEFHDGLAWVYYDSPKGQKCGYADEEGNIVIDLDGSYKTLYDFNNGSAYYVDKNTNILNQIDTKGNVLRQINICAYDSFYVLNQDTIFYICSDDNTAYFEVNGERIKWPNFYKIGSKHTFNDAVEDLKSMSNMDENGYFIVYVESMYEIYQLVDDNIEYITNANDVYQDYLVFNNDLTLDSDVKNGKVTFRVKAKDEKVYRSTYDIVNNTYTELK